MATIDELVSRLPLDQIAKQLGVDEATAATATKEASEALVQGMKANAQDQAAAASLAKAIADHAKKVGDKTADDIDVANIDTADGEAIVKNVFGDNEEQVVNQLGGLGGGSEPVQEPAPDARSDRDGLPRQAGRRECRVGSRRRRWRRWIG